MDAPEVITVRKLLTELNLRIPNYQRAYSWDAANALDLVKDIHESMHSPNSRYRIGTIITHSNDEYDDVVDGQQRIITFALIYKALDRNGAFCNDIENLDKPKLRIGEKQHTSNLYTNYQRILKYFLSTKEEIKDFARYFLDQCEVLKITTDNLSQAFQMFDSQNSRGKALDPTDLLKAFHLREMEEYSKEDSEYDMTDAVNKWEQIVPTELSKLFSDYLFRILQWSSNHRCTQPFSASDIHLFKGVEPCPKDILPWQQSIYVLFNKYYRASDRQSQGEYPFQIDQPLINGMVFFDMVCHYHKMLKELQNMANDEHAPESLKVILQNIDDPYYRRICKLFLCIMLYLCDRFGTSTILADTAPYCDAVFQYVAGLRFSNKRVSDRSIDIFASNSKSDQSLHCNIFNTIRCAQQPDEVCEALISASAVITIPIDVRIDDFKQRYADVTHQHLIDFREIRDVEEFVNKLRKYVATGNTVKLETIKNLMHAQGLIGNHRGRRWQVPPHYRDLVPADTNDNITTDTLHKWINAMIQAE